MPEIGLSGSMSGEWKRDLRAPAPFLDSTAPGSSGTPTAGPQRKDRPQRTLPLRLHPQIQTLLRQPLTRQFDKFRHLVASGINNLRNEMTVVLLLRPPQMPV